MDSGSVFRKLEAPHHRPHLSNCLNLAIVLLIAIVLTINDEITGSIQTQDKNARIRKCFCDFVLSQAGFGELCL